MTRFANCIGWAAIIGALHFSIGCTGPVREGTGNTDSGSSLRSSDLAARFEAIAPKGEVGMTVAITGYEAAAVEELTVKHLWGGHQDELARIILDDKAGWRSSPWYAYMERAFADAWRIGRGPRLTREVLEDAGVPRRYIDGITEMAHDFGGDAKRLVAALRARTDDRAKGIHTTTLDSVVEALVATGHLDDREPLTRDAAFAAVLVAANDHVKRGEIDTAAVGTLFERLWRQCTDAEAR